MRRNLSTGLKGRRRGDPMGAYDRLPPAARAWLSEAVLPWSARSIARAWSRALREVGGCEVAASDRMSRIEASLIAKDAPRIWGTDTPPGA